MVVTQDFKRYVGAQTGIYIPKGEKVGRVSHLRNTEYLYDVTSDADVVREDILAVTGVQTVPPLGAS